jgi:hypothetical protein
MFKNTFPVHYVPIEMIKIGIAKLEIRPEKYNKKF